MHELDVNDRAVSVAGLERTIIYFPLRRDIDAVFALTQDLFLSDACIVSLTVSKDRFHRWIDINCLLPITVDKIGRKVDFPHQHLAW